MILRSTGIYVLGVNGYPGAKPRGRVEGCSWLRTRPCT